MDRVLTQFEDVVPVTTATPGAAAWTAREPDDGRRVLIKRLAGEGAKKRATQALALQHPRIVPTRRWLRDEDHLYVVRDYVAGRNLRQTLTEASQRAFDRLQAFLTPILDALDYAHQAGLPHGAVTPENVLVVDGIGHARETLLCDFALTEHQDGVHNRYVPHHLLSPVGSPTPRADFYALCELYKEFLPERPAGHEVEEAARARLMRNLSETQQTARSVEELRYKLDAVAKMADLLGFSSRAPEAHPEAPHRGARLVCAVSPPTATLNPGGGTTVVLAVDNEGDTALRIESVGADVVWLNYHTRFVPFTLAPDTGCDLIWTLSGARLQAGTYNAGIIVRSNHGLTTLTPSEGEPWPERRVALPVLVRGPGAEAEAPPAPPPLAEALPLETPPMLAHTETGDHPGIACTQEPDPGLVRGGQNGVLHIGVKNIGPGRLRVNKISAWPPWLVYPGNFQPLWIEPGETQFLGFSVVAAGLTGGDYKAEVTFVTSALVDTLLGAQTVWREMKCDVRVRVVRGVGGGGPGAASGKAGCLPLVLGLIASSGLLGLLVWFWR